MRMPLVAGVLFGGQLLGCGCFDTWNPCSALRGNGVVFIGRVLANGGAGFGSGPSRVLVEEGLLNAPKEQHEVSLNTGEGTSCYTALKLGERYLIHAKSNSGTAGLGLSIEPCSQTFLIAGEEAIADALRNAARGGTARFLGALRMIAGDPKEDKVGGQSVVVRSETNRYSSTTDGKGRFEIQGMVPGHYRIEVAKPGYKIDPSYGKRSGAAIELKDGIVVRDGSCEVKNLWLREDEEISGSVTSEDGAPLTGIEVQAFEVDKDRKRNHPPQRTAVTDTEGRFVLAKLSGGEYVVGVNASADRDTSPYRETLFARTVKVGAGLSVRNVDLKLGDKRLGVTLGVTVLGLDGLPVRGAQVTLRSPGGMDRWVSTEVTSATGRIEVPVYEGEEYVVKAATWGPEHYLLEGTTSVPVVRGRTLVTVVMRLVPR